jgi:phage virion morphogenesis protein
MSVHARDFNMSDHLTIRLENAASAALQALIDRVGAPIGFLSDIGDDLVDSAKARIANQTGAPDGTPWAPLSPRTLKRKKGTRILYERGHLFGSIRKEATDDQVAIGSPTVYAAIHQLGGTIQKQAGSRYAVGRRFARREQPGGADRAIGAHTITIPARPYLGVSAADESLILSKVEDWLAGNF